MRIFSIVFLVGLAGCIQPCGQEINKESYQISNDINGCSQPTCYDNQYFYYDECKN